MDAVVQIIITIVGSGLTGLIIMLFTLPEIKKAKQLENSGSEISTAKEVANVWEGNVSYASEEREKMTARIDALTEETERLRDEKAVKQNEIFALKEENINLRALVCYTRACKSRNPPLGSLNANCDNCDGGCTKAKQNGEE